MHKEGKNGFDKKAYIIKTFSRTKRKDEENYVVNAIWQRLLCRAPAEKMENLQPVTQQYVKRADNRYGLIDLYFPQLNIAVECDEGYHDSLEQSQKDERRILEMEKSLADDKILKMLAVDESKIKYPPLRIKAGTSYDELNKQIDDAVQVIMDEMNKRELHWDFDTPAFELALRAKSLSVQDGLVFRTAWEVSECFHCGYRKGMQELFFRVQDGRKVWCPLLTVQKNGAPRNVGRTGWKNYLEEDGNVIYEFNDTRRVDDQPETGEERIVFAKSADSLGRNGYRFIGVYKFTDFDPTSKRRKYIRIGDRISLTAYHKFYDVCLYALKKLSENNKDIIFEEALCEKGRYIRFSTSALCSVFPRFDDFESGWGFAPYALYEIDAGRWKNIRVDLVFSTHGAETLFKVHPEVERSFFKCFKKIRPENWVHKKISEASVHDAEGAEEDAEEKTEKILSSCLDALFLFEKRNFSVFTR